MKNKNIDIINCFDLNLLTSKFNTINNFIFEKSKKKKVFVHININNLYILKKNKNLKSELDNKCIYIFDGIGMKIGAFLLGHGWRSDLNGTDLFNLFIKQANKNNIKLFFLGSKKKILHLMIRKLLSEFNKLKIVGFHSGYFNINNEEQIVKKINKSEANILFISRGFPLQEEFTIRNYNKLNVSFIWNVGGLFDTVSNYKPRAPLFIRELRLEWLYRFVLEPHRMWVRNIIVPIWFLFYILKIKLRLNE